MDTCKVSVLGSEYQIERKKYQDYKKFEKQGAGGFCNGATKQIVLCDMSTVPGWEDETEEAVAVTERNGLYHELVHAFLYESGLEANSLHFEAGWATNEEMIDWLAMQGEKIYQAFRKASVELSRNFKRI